MRVVLAALLVLAFKYFNEYVFHTSAVLALGSAQLNALTSDQVAALASDAVGAAFFRQAGTIVWSH